MSRRTVGRRRAAAAGGGSGFAERFPVSLPVGDLQAGADLGSGTWRQTFANDFDYTVPLGGIVPNASGTALAAGSYAKVNTDIDDWAAFYADGWNSTWGEKVYALESGEAGYPGNITVKAKWYPSKTVSFGDSCFRVHFHSEDLNNDGVRYGLGAGMLLRNNNTGAANFNMGPYLRYQFRMRHTNHVGLTEGDTSYWTSVPLAINTTNWPGNGEFNWPDMDANKTVKGTYHPAAAQNESWVMSSADRARDWHVFTVEWAPGRVKWWIDDKLMWNTTDRVPTQWMHVVMQHEQNWRPGVGSAVMEMDWLSIWQYEAP